MNFQTPFTTRTGVRLPIIMAPMFLVSNESMIRSAIDSGIMGVFPTLNFRDKGQLEAVLTAMNAYLGQSRGGGSYGVNLIVQRSNPLYERHLEICVQHKVPFYITSLGSPAEVIKKAHGYGVVVYCDVTNLEHAAKVASLGCDGFIAVGQGAGGHAGPNPLTVLVPALRKKFPDIPVIGAGGIVSGESVVSMMVLGSAGVSIGTRFIATPEAGVNNEYKQAIVESDMDDIVMTEKLSGTPCTIINTSYAKKIGYRQNALERLLSRNKRTKKYFKMLVQIRGIRKLEKAVLPGNYQNLWCAGKSVALIDEIKPCGEIIQEMEQEMIQSVNDLMNFSKS
jgi:nitronate monooxygenase